MSPCCSCSCRRSCAPLPRWCPAGCFFTWWSLFQVPMSILFSCFFMFVFLFPLPCAFESRSWLRASFSQPRCLAGLEGMESEILLRSNQLPQPRSIASHKCLPFFLTPLRVTRRRHATAPQMHTLRRSRSDGVPRTSSAKQREDVAFGIAGRGTVIFHLSSLQGLLQGHIQQRSSRNQKPIRSVR